MIISWMGLTDTSLPLMGVTSLSDATDVTEIDPNFARLVTGTPTGRETYWSLRPP